VPDFVSMDALRLRQILFNLVGNALKFTDAGVVEVFAEAKPKSKRAVLMHFAIKDSGVGISPEHLPMLFERFSQADDSEIRKFGGTGLGLAIAKQLTELMGGRIWAESTPGEGSTFHVEIPMALAEQVTPVMERPPAALTAYAEEAHVRGVRVLAVDDNAVNLLVLDQLLTAFGHTVAKAASGPEALGMLAAQPFDIVLLDIQMPGMTGVEALQKLRETPGPNQQVPVVALTADVTSGGRGHFQSLGLPIAVANDEAPPSSDLVHLRRYLFTSDRPPKRALAGDVEQDRRGGPAVHAAVVDAGEQDQRAGRVETEGDRQQQRDGQRGTDAGQHTDRGAKGDTDQRPQ